MEEISLPKAKIVEEKENYGKIVIEPLYPGYGHTLGNALRRVLISSLSGAAISTIKIENASHEFSTLPGVKEDVIEIILKLKQLRLKLHDEDKATMKLQVKGPKEILALDIKTPSQIEILNKDLHIATLDSSKASLNIEMVVEKGRGYVAAENKPEKPEIGIIQTDSLYSPVTWVNLSVENTRVQQRTDFNKLTLEIKTDGTILPSEAFTKATEILVNQFDVLKNLEGKAVKKVKKPKIAKKISKKEKKDEKKVTAKKRAKKSAA